MIAPFVVSWIALVASAILATIAVSAKRRTQRLMDQVRDSLSAPRCRVIAMGDLRDPPAMVRCYRTHQHAGPCLVNPIDVRHAGYIRPPF